MRCRGCAIEQRPDWYAKNIRDLLNPASADPVSALLVFLNLLERDANTRAKFSLGQTHLEPANPDVLSNQHVNRERTSSSHSTPNCLWYKRSTQGLA